MIKIYQVRKNLNLDIITIEAKKVTSHFYLDKFDRRSALNTDFYKCFLDLEEAKDYLKSIIQYKISQLESSLDYHKKEMDKFNEMYSK